MSRRFQFSVRALLGAVAVIAVVLGSFCQHIWSQKSLITSIEARGGTVVYARRHGGMGHSADSPAWLRPFDGRLVHTVIFTGDQFSDEDLPGLAVFPELGMVAIGDGTKVTKAGMASLREQLPNCIVRPYRMFLDIRVWT